MKASIPIRKEEMTCLDGKENARKRKASQKTRLATSSSRVASEEAREDVLLREQKKTRRKVRFGSSELASHLHPIDRNTRRIPLSSTAAHVRILEAFLLPIRSLHVSCLSLESLVGSIEDPCVSSTTSERGSDSDSDDPRSDRRSMVFHVPFHRRTNTRSFSREDVHEKMMKRTKRRPIRSVFAFFYIGNVVGVFFGQRVPFSFASLVVFPSSHVVVLFPCTPSIDGMRWE